MANEFHNGISGLIIHTNTKIIPLIIDKYKRIYKKQKRIHLATLHNALPLLTGCEEVKALKNSQKVGSIPRNPLECASIRWKRPNGAILLGWKLSPVVFRPVS